MVGFYYSKLDLNSHGSKLNGTKLKIFLLIFKFSFGIGLASSRAIQKNIQMKNIESYVLDRTKTHFLNQSGHLKPLENTPTTI